jgi:transcriptional regulator with XRE-family HTH domain
MTSAEGVDPIDVAVGARLRIRRQELRMSQQGLAEGLGVSFQQVQKYERGANRISASMLVRAARALKCSGAFLLGTPLADAASAPVTDTLQAELNGLLATPGAVDLLRAFVQIRDRTARSGLLAVARAMVPQMPGRPQKR